MQALRILVCGTNYGRSYLEAIQLDRTKYRLAGILARGSARSQQIARECGVPLHRGVEELPAGMDLACAAMGRSGSDVVMALLRRGIPVLCEHPMSPEHLRAALEATGSRVCFHVNGHFAQLASAAAFIRDWRRFGLREPPAFVQVTATDRSLYAVLDIIGRALSKLAPFEFHLCGQIGPFAVIQGLLGVIPAVLYIQCRGARSRLPDGSAEYVVDHRITVGFASGVLTLLSMTGPVIWNENLNCVRDAGRPLFSVVQEERKVSAEMLHQERIAANLQAIDTLAGSMRDGVTPAEQQPGYLLDLSGAWERVGQLL